MIFGIKVISMCQGTYAWQLFFGCHVIWSTPVAQLTNFFTDQIPEININVTLMKFIIQLKLVLYLGQR
jgi:hypothetical protein